MQSTPKCLLPECQLSEHPLDGCWEWPRGRTAAGYGRVSRDGREHYVHRLVYELTYGPIPPGWVVDHTCRNRACIRPDHLQAVTRKQNNENLGVDPRNRSGVRGVSWDRINSKWRASVKHNGRAYNVGRFATLAEAERAVIAKRNELFTNNLADR
jgi:hypothetical protein